MALHFRRLENWQYVQEDALKYVAKGTPEESSASKQVPKKKPKIIKKTKYRRVYNSLLSSKEANQKEIFKCRLWVEYTSTPLNKTSLDVPNAHSYKSQNLFIYDYGNQNLDNFYYVLLQSQLLTFLL